MVQVRWILAAAVVFGTCNSASAIGVSVQPVTRVAAGSEHLVLVRADGTIWTWGSNEYGQLGVEPSGEGTYSSVPVQVGNDTDWALAAAGSQHTLVLKRDGTLWAWGDNSQGRLGDGTYTSTSVPVRVGTDSDWATVSAGSCHSVALKTDGTLWTWGDLGRRPDGSGVHEPSPIQLGTADDWIAVAAGDYHNIALKADDTLWAWGQNWHGQLGTGYVDGNTRFQPVQVGTATDWVAVTAGAEHSAALKADGTLCAWGRNDVGQLGEGRSNFGADKPRPICIGGGWTTVAAGGHCTVALKADGTLWAWGANICGQLGDGTHTDRTVPVQVDEADDWVAAAAGPADTIAVKRNGTVWVCGSNGFGRLGNGTLACRTSPAPVCAQDTWAAVSPGLSYTVALKANGTVWAWGYNPHGQLGDGTTVSKAMPVQAGTGGWAAVEAGNSHTVALKADGTLWAWGYNNHGQLGDGTTKDKFSPVRADTGGGYRAIAAGGSHALALKLDGTLWAWGYNAYGQVGDGTTVDKLRPVQVGTRADWVAVAAGDYHTLGLTSDGTLWAWGHNDSGQLGDGTSGFKKNKTNPIQVGTPGEWATVGAGYAHTVAVKADGTLWAWGHNLYGQLGDGTRTSRSSPVRVGTETDWAFPAPGWQHTLALKADGTLWAWGRNNGGELGDGTFTDSTTPVQVSGAADWAIAEAGAGVSYALKTDGTLWGWGSGGGGEFADGYLFGGWPWRVQVVLPWVDAFGPVVSVSGRGAARVGEDLVLSGAANDQEMGGSVIAGAAYSLDGVTWVEMSAADGVFDSAFEEVTAAVDGLSAGVYSVVLSAWDAAARTGYSAPLLVAVYDASGFAVGGGWVESPAGSLYPGVEEYAGVAGKAHFDFMARYPRGADVPTGHAAFQFKAGGLHFKSSTFEWLVVAGTRAQLKGEGRLNGAAGFDFMLTCEDRALRGKRQQERLRMKIWAQETGELVYDNYAGADDTGDLDTDGTLVRGGNIVVYAGRANARGERERAERPRREAVLPAPARGDTGGSPAVRGVKKSDPVQARTGPVQR